MALCTGSVLLLPPLRPGPQPPTSSLRLVPYTPDSQLRPVPYLQSLPLTQIRPQDSRAPLITFGFWVAEGLTGQGGLLVALWPDVIRAGDGDLGGIWEQGQGVWAGETV